MDQLEPLMTSKPIRDGGDADNGEQLG
jgi:hypothetical protein